MEQETTVEHSRISVRIEEEALEKRRITRLRLLDAEEELRRKVYEATLFIEQLEQYGMIDGNGHHIRQAMAEAAVEKLRSRWRTVR